MSSRDREGVGCILQAKGRHGDNSERGQECWMKQHRRRQNIGERKRLEREEMGERRRGKEEERKRSEEEDPGTHTHTETNTDTDKEEGRGQILKGFEGHINRLRLYPTDVGKINRVWSRWLKGCIWVCRANSREKTRKQGELITGGLSLGTSDFITDKAPCVSSPSSEPPHEHSTVLTWLSQSNCYQT